MNRITWHHTGGGFSPNATDLRAYHRLIDGDGRVVRGNHPPEANLVIRNPRDASTYAAHTRGLNTANIGMSVCCMGDGNWSRPFEARLFPRPQQIDALIADSAMLCRRYGIPVSRKTTLSHAEVETTLGIAQRGKWDFDYHPRQSSATRNAVAIGDELRQELKRVLGGEAIRPAPAPRPTIRRGARGQHVQYLQSRLGLAQDGIFGPATDNAVRNFQAANELLPDGVVGALTWSALG